MKIYKLLGSEIDLKYTHPASSTVIRFDKEKITLALTVRNRFNQSVLIKAVYYVAKSEVKLGHEMMRLGEQGTFFESGVSYPYLMHQSNEEKLFFTGWALGKTVPFYNQIGISRYDEGSMRFEPTERIPTKIYGDSTSIGIGSVGGVRYNGTHYLYYTSFSRWSGSHEEKHKYTIRGATSEDGIIWRSFSDSGLLNLPLEFNCVCRPSIVNLDSNRLIMFFSYRTNKGDYKLGLAKSEDARNWTVDLDNKLLKSLSNSTQSWFEKGMCYPNAFLIENDFYLFFGGNCYGKDGFGVLHLSTNKFIDLIIT